MTVILTADGLVLKWERVLADATVGMLGMSLAAEMASRQVHVWAPLQAAWLVESWVLRRVERKAGHEAAVRALWSVEMTVRIVVFGKVALLVGN